MARVCEICGKTPIRGHNVSHANNKTKRMWLPNLQRVRVLRDGRVVRMRVCAKCIKGGRIVKAPTVPPTS